MKLQARAKIELNEQTARVQPHTAAKLYCRPVAAYRMCAVRLFFVYSSRGVLHRIDDPVLANVENNTSFDKKLGNTIHKILRMFFAEYIFTCADLPVN